MSAKKNCRSLWKISSVLKLYQIEIIEEVKEKEIHAVCFKMKVCLELLFFDKKHH